MTAHDNDKAHEAAEREMPTLPKILLDLIGEYGMARTDGVNELEIQHRWLMLIDGIKEYARSVLKASEAKTAVPEGWTRIKDHPPKQDQPVFVAWDLSVRAAYRAYAISGEGDNLRWYDVKTGDYCKWEVENYPSYWMPWPDAPKPEAQSTT